MPTIASGNPLRIVPRSRIISTKFKITLSKTSLNKSGAVPNSTLTLFDVGISNVPNIATTSGRSTISTSIEDTSVAKPCLWNVETYSIFEILSVPAIKIKLFQRSSLGSITRLGSATFAELSAV